MNYSDDELKSRLVEDMKHNNIFLSHNHERGYEIHSHVGTALLLDADILVDLKTGFILKDDTNSLNRSSDNKHFIDDDILEAYRRMVNRKHSKEPHFEDDLFEV